MVSFERMHRIMDILSKRKVVSTTELESMIYCSTSTLRRDLIALEKEGKLIRSHGEVRLSTASNMEYSYAARAHEASTSKAAIADIASTFLTHNQSIFLDSSTTAASLIPYFSDLHNLRIITNGIEAARQMNDYDNITLFLSGGHIDYGTNSALGDFATHFVNNFHADIAFISCRGLDRYAAYEANHNQALIKQHMITNADKVILLADHSKFNTSHYFKLANYHAIDYIVTDQEPIASFQETVGRQCEIMW